MKHLLTVLALSIHSSLVAQTLFTPGGTVGVSSNGSVGIGTSTPQAVTNFTAVDIRGTMGGAISLGSASLRTGLLYSYSGATVFGSVDTSPLILTTADVERLRIDGTGNVGIGTNTLGSRRLSVQSSSSNNDVGVEITLGRTMGANYGLIVSANGSGATLNQGIFATAANGASNFGLRIYNVEATANNYSLYSDSPAQSYFQGNVGIGTTSPTHKLAVNGAVRAKEVIVDTGWSDYVFAADYRLAPLSEVEAHILAKKHLPGIPSAAEVEAQGVSIGEMQSKLLAKIEELTLHQIAQEKAMTALKEENARLTARFEHLERR